MRAVFVVLVFIQMDIGNLQNIIPKHRRQHCQALQSTDIMEQAMPELRRIIEAETTRVRRHYEAMLATLRGGVILRCTAGWVYYNDNCYLFLNAKNTWQDTREECQGRRAYLLEIRSAEENNFIKSEIKKIGDRGRSYFLAGTDRDSEGTWIWVRTGERIGFTDWGVGEPSNKRGIEHCLIMYEGENYLWNDVPCSENLYGICKTSVTHNTFP